MVVKGGSAGPRGMLRVGRGRWRGAVCGFGRKRLGVRVSVNLIFELSPDLAFSRKPRGGPTLTNSNGALPTQTTAPLAPPASKLVMATSPAVSLLNRPSRKSIQGGDPPSDEASMPDEGPGSALSIRFVEV